MKTKKLLLTVLFVFSPWSLGNNLQPAVMLNEKFEDSFTNSAPEVFKLQRTYHSRSLHRGLLGYGWCLQFEKVLIKQPDGRIDYYSCTSDKPVSFQLHHQREDNLIYKPQNAKDYMLVQQQTQWNLKDPQGNFWDFDSGGMLRRWRLQNNQKFYLIRTRAGTLESLSGPFGRVRFTTDPETGLLETIKGTKHALHFQFKNHLLTSVTSPQTSWNYDYDPSRNLTKIIKNGRLIKSISYNLQKDQVQQLMESSYLVTLNDAGQIESMKHPAKGMVYFNYDPEGAILSIQWNKKLLSMYDLKNIRHPSQQDTGLVEYLLVASRTIKSLQSL